MSATTAEALVSTPGRGWVRVQRMALATSGFIFVTAWAFAEGLVWPLIAEMPLLLLIVTVALHRPRRAALLIIGSAAASALGVLLNWLLTSHGVPVPLPLTTHRMMSIATAQLASDPLGAFWNQTVNFIPVKVYASAAGHLHMGFLDLLQAMAPRVFRILLVGTTGWVVGNLISRWLKPHLGKIQIICLSFVPVALTLIILAYS
jgi:1-acyl-sn-glycerol-3-phosphate acyltransferase